MSHTLIDQIKQLGQQARQAAQQLVLLNSEQKNQLLQQMANNLRQHAPAILAANAKDMSAGREKNLNSALLDRLELTNARIEAMAAGIEQIVQLPDPVDDVLDQHTNAAGLLIKKVRVPIGVIAMIYESRPNVTADVAALCLKTSNAIILRGGSEAFHSNQAILIALLDQLDLPEHAIQLVQSKNREAIKHLVQLDQHVDLAIPRGGEGLIRAVVEHAHVPVIKHYKGLCHTYVDAKADLAMAEAIVINAKTQRPGVCNAMETLLVHRDVAEAFLPTVCTKLRDKNVELRGDDTCQKIVAEVKAASEDDWDTEYLDLVLSIKVIDDLSAAINHINQHGSHHSDAIITSDQQVAARFTKEVDSATVYVNASTRFTDGSEFGMGAEIGISTDKLHARGPMGLAELTTYKYVILGTGQVRN